MTTTIVENAKPATWKPDTFAGQSRMDLSKQWMSRPHDQRFLDLDSLYESTHKMFEASKTRTLDPRKSIEIITPDGLDDRHSLGIVLDDEAELAFSHHTFSQLAGLASAPGGYLRTLPAALVADNLNWGLKVNRKIDSVKLYHTDTQLRAATGPDYGRIPDYEVVEAVRKMAGSGTGEARWKIPGTLDWRTGEYDPRAKVTIDSTTLYASDRDVFMFLVDDLNPIEIGKTKDGRPDYVFRGFYVYNSEVGIGAMKIAAFYLRAVCCNRIMWGVEGFEEISIRHSKYAPDRFLEQAQPALQSYANGSVQKLMDGIEKAKTAKIARNDDDLADFLKERKFSKERAKKIMDAVLKEEGHKARTVWDVAQGITAVARDEKNNDTRVELEREAGKLLNKVA